MRTVSFNAGFPEDPRLVELPPAVLVAFVRGACYCSRKRNGGIVPETELARVMGVRPLQTLIGAGVISRNPDGSVEFDRYLVKISRWAAPSAARVAWTRISSAVRPRILARDGYRCQNCGSTSRLHIDHIVPLAKGGSSDDSNLQVLCQPCNQRKWAH